MTSAPRLTLLQRFAGLATNRTAAMVMMAATGLLGVAFVAAPSLLGLKEEAFVQQWISAGSGGGQVLSLVVVIAAFCLLALLGAPQFVLVAATVVAFGSITGFIYSFIGNYLACILGFWMGKGLGSGALRTLGGPKLERFMKRLAKHDILTCAVIRVVPTAPFMIVN
ncbi:MAG: TVP38/TMEM64 family protein, partial [Caulobacteraceae bacterium]